MGKVEGDSPMLDVVQAEVRTRPLTATGKGGKRRIAHLTGDVGTHNNDSTGRRVRDRICTSAATRATFSGRARPLLSAYTAGPRTNAEMGGRLQTAPPAGCAGRAEAQLAVFPAAPRPIRLPPLRALVGWPPGAQVCTGPKADGCPDPSSPGRRHAASSRRDVRVPRPIPRGRERPSGPSSKRRGRHVLERLDHRYERSVSHHVAARGRRLVTVDGQVFVAADGAAAVTGTSGSFRVVAGASDSAYGACSRLGTEWLSA